MKERLQKIISRAGLTSRRTAELWIKDGRVRVNGEIVTQLGSKADPETDLIEVDGRRLKRQPPSVFLMLNKPAGCVTTLHDPQGRPTVIDLLPRVKQRVFPVGRLDFSTTGLLILTNDGELTRKLEHPSSRIPRVYEVKILGNLDEAALRRLERGIPLETGRTLPCAITVLKTSERSQWLKMTLYEGRNRQIHRMMASVRRDVLKIRRTQFGPLKLGGLALGMSRKLTPAEVGRLTSSVI